MSLKEQIEHYNKKLSDYTKAVYRTLTMSMDALKDEGIEGYSFEHMEDDNTFIVSKAGNTAFFAIDLEKYIQAEIFDDETVDAFQMISGGESFYTVKIPESEIKKLHNSFATEIDHLLKNFVIFVETAVLGVPDEEDHSECDHD
ncbi:MAG: hypothetical protein COB02_11715 [Candidatus Cloacimonadota bacterium]|nr:MAG: hypothetical protein COB02_11715 [Candidatus Cloacimonadota bacterium]